MNGTLKTNDNELRIFAYPGGKHDKDSQTVSKIAEKLIDVYHEDSNYYLSYTSN